MVIVIHKAAIADTKNYNKLFQPVTGRIKSSLLRNVSILARSQP